MATVLYVDDEPAIRRLVRRWFEKRGVTIITAESVAEAQRLFTEHEVAGAFVDVWLGRETGFDLYAWIVEHRPQLKDRIVFITGDVDAGVPEGTQLQALGRIVIAKPFELEDLELHVREWARAPARRSGPVAQRSP
ncbi:MAG TPA: response regulator [Gemmatimonadaceae bacterium]|nr:response regulator [Gemmatimonadaceae bacterium]